MKILSKVHREKYDFGGITPTKEIQPSVPTATAAMRAFDHDLKDGECVRDEQLLSVNGWLDQNGILFGCGWLQHDASVKSFGYENERDACRAGIIRLANMKWQIEKRFATDTLISEVQYITIEKWHQENKLQQDYFNYWYKKLKTARK